MNKGAHNLRIQIKIVPTDDLIINFSLSIYPKGKKLVSENLQLKIISQIIGISNMLFWSMYYDGCWQYDDDDDDDEE